jgi:BON domain
MPTHTSANGAPRIAALATNRFAAPAVSRRSIFFVLVFALVLTPLFAQKKITDDMIVDQVRVKLADDADVGGQRIDVDVHQGAVTLKGKVRSDKQKSKAEKLAKKVKGVTSVINQLVVSPD